MARKRSRRLILRDKCDNLMSKCVRLSAANAGGIVECYTCGLQVHWKYGADAGHWKGRSQWPTRWHVDNVKPQCKRCNKWGRRNEQNQERLAHAEKYGARFVGPGESDVFEARLRFDGVDVEALTRLSRGPGQTVDELEELHQFLKDCWEGLANRR